MGEQTNKVIIISAIVVALASAGLQVPDMIPEKNYYCDYRLDLGLVECPDGFSKYVDVNGKCLNSVTGKNLICRTGWQLVEDDRAVYDEEEFGPQIPVHSWTDGMNKIVCTKDGCAGVG